MARKEGRERGRGSGLGEVGREAEEEKVGVGVLEA